MSSTNDRTRTSKSKKRRRPSNVRRKSQQLDEIREQQFMARGDNGVADENVDEQSPRKKQRLKKESIGGDRKKTPLRVRKKSLLNEIDGSNSNNSSKSINSNCNDNNNNNNGNNNINNINNSSTNSIFLSSSTSSSISLSPSSSSNDSSDSGSPNDGRNNNRKTTTRKTTTTPKSTVPKVIESEENIDHTINYDVRREMMHSSCVPDDINSNKKYHEGIVAIANSIVDFETKMEQLRPQIAAIVGEENIIINLPSLPYGISSDESLTTLVLHYLTSEEGKGLNGLSCFRATRGNGSLRCQCCELVRLAAGDTTYSLSITLDVLPIAIPYESTLEEYVGKALADQIMKEYLKVINIIMRNVDNFSFVAQSAMKAMSLYAYGDEGELARKFECGKDEDSILFRKIFVSLDEKKLIVPAHPCCLLHPNKMSHFETKAKAWDAQSTLLRRLTDSNAADCKLFTEIHTANSEIFQLIQRAAIQSCINGGKESGRLRSCGKKVANFIISIGVASNLYEAATMISEYAAEVFPDELSSKKKKKYDSMQKLYLSCAKQTLASSVAGKLATAGSASSKYDATNAPGFTDALARAGSMSEEEAHKLAKRYRSSAELNLASSVAGKLATAGSASSKYDATNAPEYIDALVLEGKMSEEEAQRVAERYRRVAAETNLASSIAEKLVTAEVASSKYDATNTPEYIDALVLEGSMSEEEAHKLAEGYRKICMNGDGLSLASSVAEKFETAGIASSIYHATNLPEYTDALARAGSMSEEEAHKLAKRYRSSAELNLASSVAGKLVTAGVASSTYDATNAPGFTDALARAGSMSEEEAHKLAERYRSSVGNKNRLNLASSIAEKLVTAEVASSKYDATNKPEYINALVREGKMSEEEAHKLAEGYRRLFSSAAVDERAKELERSYEKKNMKIRPGKLGLTIKIEDGGGAEITDIGACCGIVGNISVGDIIFSIGQNKMMKKITAFADFAVNTDEWRRIVIFTKKKTCGTPKPGPV